MKIADPDGADKETVLRIVADVGSSRLMPATSRPGVCLSSKGSVAISPSSSRGAKMPQIERPHRALGWFTPILKKQSSYGHPR